MEYLQYVAVASRAFWHSDGFKPCYKWNTFNTNYVNNLKLSEKVLNLVINGIPSILVPEDIFDTLKAVLNLVINGIPSILHHIICLV